MESRSLPQSCFFRCTGLNVSTSTLLMGLCLPFRNAFRRRPALIPPRCWVLPKTRGNKDAPLRQCIPRFARIRIQSETVTNLHRAEPTHAAADDFRSVYRDPTGRRPLLMGSGFVRDRGIQRWLGWLVSPQVAPANSAWPISRPYRGQALVEHDVPGAFHSAQDSVEVYGARIQPRYFHPGCQRGAVYHCGIAQFPPQHLRKGEYFFADCRSVLRDAVLRTAGALDLDCAHGRFARHLFLHHYLSAALCFSCATPAAHAHSRSAFAFSRRRARQLTLFPASP